MLKMKKDAIYQSRNRKSLERFSDSGTFVKITVLNQESS